MDNPLMDALCETAFALVLVVGAVNLVKEMVEVEQLPTEQEMLIEDSDKLDEMLDNLSEEELRHYLDTRRLCSQ